MARINAVSFHEDKSIESICRRIRAAGFDSVELSRPPFFEKLVTKELRKRFQEYARENGLSLHGFDCWVEVDPYSARQETLDGFRAAIEFAVDLDLKMIISHDPWAQVNGPRSPAECLRINIEFFREVADMTAAHGLKLIFEPHPDTLSMDDNWAIDFIDGIGRAHVGLLFDCCHYGVGQPKTYLQAIARLGARIQHVHFSDGDRRTYALHLPIGDGELDLKAVVGEFRQLNFKGTLTNDMYNYPLLDDGARRNASLIRQLETELGLGA
jgi:sugar phosphate isomerase/epimerase